MFNLIPLPYRILAVLALIASLLSFGWLQGARHVQKNWDLEVQKQTIAVLKVRVKTAEVSAKVITKYVDRIVKVKDINNETLRQVPNLITANDDSSCRLPNSFDWLHDSAASGVPISIPAGKPHDSSSTTTLSTATETIVENYGICHETEERLKSLQEWVREQQKVSP